MMARAIRYEEGLCLAIPQLNATHDVSYRLLDEL